MMDNANRALLPAGLRDFLPLDAAFEADTITRLMAYFAGQGYERVKPPLIEFEETLLAGAPASAQSQCFRVMDPVSQKMMGLRADMTPQVARIAMTRLAAAPRPLRLSYAGQVLRVKGTQLRPERQFAQAGIELIGPDCAQADAEVAILAAEALMELGVADVSIDLSLPTLVPALLAELGIDAETALMGSLDHKDAAGVAAAGGRAAPLLSALLAAVGPADRALGILAGLDLPGRAGLERDRLAQVVNIIQAALPDLALTIDPVESRGFEYHTGVGFTLFARRCSGELGRGGRYLAGQKQPATGATLFMDTVLTVLAQPQAPKRLYVPLGTSRQETVRLRCEGWVTVCGLEKVADAALEAQRLECGHYLANDQILSV